MHVQIALFSQWPCTRKVTAPSHVIDPGYATTGSGAPGVYALERSSTCSTADDDLDTQPRNVFSSGNDEHVERSFRKESSATNEVE
jgi:hypothetical protein